MPFELKDGQGNLFRNDRKEEDRHPDYKGQAMIDGTLYDIAAWLKEGKKGKFFSLSIKVPMRVAPKKTASPDPFEDDPFKDDPF
jgi:uncharacterized protein (DUF736 family)